jgi:hypothetical protein
VQDEIEEDIVDRLRSWGPMWRPQDQISIDMNHAADEIQRLRRNTGCARNQGTTQFCAEALDAQRDVEKLRKELSEARYDYRRLMTQMLRERDEARLLYCELFAFSMGRTADDVAMSLKWDCFKTNAARRSTAPTPANTGGGADHQIPEAL